METKTTRFEADTINEGVDAYTLDFSPRLHYGFGLKNVTNAQKDGLSPRYGMAPIPNHSHTISQSPTTQISPGLMQAETTTYSQFTNRKKIFGIIPFNYGTYDDIDTQKQHYVFLCTSGTTTKYLNFYINSEYNGSSTFFEYKGDISKGLSGISFVNNGLTFSKKKSTSSTFRVIDENLNNVSFASFRNSGKTLSKSYWIFRVDSSYPDTATRFGLGYSATAMGVPPKWNDGRYKKGNRAVTAYSLDSSYNFMKRYDYNSKTFNNDTFNPIFNFEATTSFEPTEWGNADTVTSRDDGTAVTVGTSFYTLYKDPSTTVTSGYTAFLVAADRAYVALAQSYLRGNDGKALQYLDLTEMHLFPEAFNTASSNSTGAYKENARIKKTCWRRWPSVDLTAVTPLTTPTVASITRDGTNHIGLGAANSGILRANTQYEITFALYDYSIDTESNVGIPALIQVDSTDYVALSLFLQKTVSGTAPLAGTNEYVQNSASSYTDNPLWNLVSQLTYALGNYIEIRFYYRELGTFEWLPAGRIEYNEYMYNPDLTEYYICTGTETGLPGGQPGGFNDYSELPNESWQNVLTFNNRVFWISKDQVVFSNRDNIFQYAARNSFPCPKGSFRGGLVHTFYGQAEQNGRVVIFGSEETYFGEFTGDKITQPVRVSLDSVGNFPLDGSDFVVKVRTTITAFSSKAAVVADGTLYFWGQTGIFMDDGVGIPSKISKDLEPYLFDLYDQSYVQDIHCSYNSNSKEIIWFFTPKDTSNGLTQMLIYNTDSQKFLFWYYDNVIDWYHPIMIENEDVATAKLIAGSRYLIGVRESKSSEISRALFFDWNNKCGDIPFGQEFLVQTVANTSGDTYRFSFAAGYNATSLATVQAGDLFSTPNMREYTQESLSTTPRALWTVTAVGADYIEADKYGSMTPYTGTLDNDKCFPIYIQDIHSIAWNIETNKWCPGGLRYFYLWIFYHLVLFIDLLQSDGNQTIDVEYKSNVNTTYKKRTTVLTNNSDGFCQLVDQTIPENEVNYGQSIEFKFSGEHLGGVFALQYVAVDGVIMPEHGRLQRFESE